MTCDLQVITGFCIGRLMVRKKTGHNDECKLLGKQELLEYSAVLSIVQL